MDTHVCGAVETCGQWRHRTLQATEWLPRTWTFISTTWWTDSSQVQGQGQAWQCRRWVRLGVGVVLSSTGRARLRGAGAEP